MPKWTGTTANSTLSCLFTRAASFVLSPASVGRAEISFFKRKPVSQYSEHKRNPRDVDSVRFPLLFFFFLFFSSFFHFGTTITNRIFWRVLDDDIPRQSMKMSRLRIIYTWTYVTCMCAFFFYYSLCVFVLFSYFCHVPLIFVVVSLKWVTVSQWFMT